MTPAPLPEPLYHDPFFASFYDLQNGEAVNGERADFRYCRELAKDMASVLDLGCGTGELAVSIRQANPASRIVGVDPAASMLSVAINRPGGDHVEWIEADARSLRMGRRFDLIVMTGHAAQVFLADSDLAEALATIRLHLTQGGRFIFDSRNPSRRAWESWTTDRSEEPINHPLHGHCHVWYETDYDEPSAIASYTTSFQRSEHTHLSSTVARVRFPSQVDLNRLIVDAGLQIDQWFGDWNGTPFDVNSPEIIAFGRSARN